MNKLTLSLLLIAVIVLAVLGVYFGSKKAPVQTTQNNEEVAPPAEPLLLSVINNDVQIKELTDSQLKEVQEKSVSVHEGTYVKTSLTGRATIESNNGTTTVVDKNSEFTIARSTQNQSQIFLALGSIWAKVQKVFGKGESYQVETNNAVVTVRGTSFGVSYTIDKKTMIYVAEGTVWLLSINPVTKQAIGQEVTVNAGQKATVEDNQNPVVQAISDSDKKLDWYIFINGKPVRPEASAPSQPPTPKPELYSVTPGTLYYRQGLVNFSINGKDIKDVAKVLLGGIPIEFSVRDSRTITATAPLGMKEGIYDVSVVFSNQQTLTLTQVLTIKQ